MVEEMAIRELCGIDEIAAILPLVRQGNPHLSEAAFRERLSAMLSQGNYRCIAACLGERMVGVSGFWTGTQFWCGQYIEADHVVVDEGLRSLGAGARLMAWIEAEGERTGCRVFRATMVLGRQRTHDF